MRDKFYLFLIIMLVTVVISIFSYLSFVFIETKRNESLLVSMNENIEIAALDYFGKTSSYLFSVQTLIDENYFSLDGSDMINPVTDEIINDEVIEIIKEDDAFIVYFDLS